MEDSQLFSTNQPNEGWTKFSNWLLISTILLAALLRFYHLGTKCFWLDETFSYQVSLGERYDDSTPNLYYSLNRLFLNLPFSVETGGRVFSAVLGILTVVVIFTLTRRVLPRKIALGITLLAALNPELIQLSQEYRAYGMMTFLAALLIWATVNILQTAAETSTSQPRNRYRWWGLFIVSGTLGLYTHYMTIPLLAGLLLVFFLFKRNLEKIGLKQVLFSYLAIFLLFLPHLSHFFQRINLHREYSGHQFLHMAYAKMLFKSLWGFNIGETFDFSWWSNSGSGAKVILPIVLFFLATVALGLFIKGFWALLRNKSNIRFLPWAFIIYLAAYFQMELSSYRQIFPLLILFVIIMGVGIYTFSGWKFYTAWGSLLLLYGIVLPGYYQLPYQPMSRVDWRSVGVYLDRQVQPGDLVFAAVSDLAYLSLDFYYGGALIPTDEEVNLYHSGPEHLKRKIRNSDVLGSEMAVKLEQLLRLNKRVFVVVEGFTDRITPQTTSLQPTSELEFCPWLRIKEFVNPTLTAP